MNATIRWLLTVAMVASATAIFARFMWDAGASRSGPALYELPVAWDEVKIESEGRRPFVCDVIINVRHIEFDDCEYYDDNP